MRAPSNSLAPSRKHPRDSDAVIGPPALGSEAITQRLYSHEIFFSTRIIVERSLRRCGVGCMKDVEKFPRMNALPSGGLQERGDDAVRLHPADRSRPEAHLAEDDHVPERLFGMIIRRRHTGDAQEGKKMLLLGADKKHPQRISRLERKRQFADLPHVTDKPIFQACCLIPRNTPGGELPRRITGP